VYATVLIVDSFDSIDSFIHSEEEEEEESSNRMKTSL
jgi:hypothetical protein